ncbi:MAG: hypothetical protein U9Q29_00335 [Campylobacterota bacterium]|nr:hypothetical protein [Campylobacterota bacterium]
MELKDVILSTLAEMEDVLPEQVLSFEEKEIKEIDEVEVKTLEEEAESTGVNSELIYLNSMRERLLVLFEGFQAPNNTNIEAKVDMTLNFLEYVLATIDSRVEMLGSEK